MNKHTTPHTIFSLFSLLPSGATLATLARLMAQAALMALALACHGARANTASAEAKADGEPPASALPTPAARVVARSLHEAATRSAVASAPAVPRLGMHLVVRLAVLDLVAHPDSGDFDLTPRSRLLNRSIARAPLALGVTWRF